MNRSIRFLIGSFTVCVILTANIQNLFAQENRQTFVASTPCDNASVREFFNIPIDLDCEQIRWKIIFRKQIGTGVLTYDAVIRYGMSLPNTNDLINRGTEITRTGKFTSVRGFQGNKNAYVYLLESNVSKKRIKYLRVNDELLHLIDPGEQLAIGNGGWSYTLNSVTKYAASLSLPDATTESADIVDGVFEGRTPCKEIAAQLKKDASPDCIKLKWRIFFYKETMTYKTDGSFFRFEPRTGKFDVSRGIPGNANAVVIQLDPDKPAESFFLLKGDDNVLFFLNEQKKCFVGNEDFSFTLNRSQKKP